MKDVIKFSSVLTLICFVSAGLLAAVNNATKGVILERKIAEVKNALEELFSSAYDFYPIESEDKKVYIALDRSNQPLGYAFQAKARGYSSEIEVLVAVDLEDDIKGIKIVSQQETPGVGTRITEKSFLKKFMGIKLSRELPVDAISGATISSSALITSIENNAEDIKELIKSNAK